MENEVNLRPKKRISFGKDARDSVLEDQVILEIRRILNKSDIHNKTSRLSYGYHHSVYYNSKKEVILYITPHVDSVAPYTKESLAKKMFDILMAEKYEVSFAKKKNFAGISVNLRKDIAMKKIEHLNANPLMDKDVIIQSILSSNEDVQLEVLNNLDRKIILKFLEKIMLK